MVVLGPPPSQMFRSHSSWFQVFKIIFCSPVVAWGPPPSQILRAHSCIVPRVQCPLQVGFLDHIVPHVQCFFSFILSLFWAQLQVKFSDHVVPRVQCPFLFCCRCFGPTSKSHSSRCSMLLLFSPVVALGPSTLLFFSPVVVLACLIITWHAKTWDQAHRPQDRCHFTQAGARPAGRMPYSLTLGHPSCFLFKWEATPQPHHRSKPVSGEAKRDRHHFWCLALGLQIPNSGLDSLKVSGHKSRNVGCFPFVLEGLPL